MDRQWAWLEWAWICWGGGTKAMGRGFTLEYLDLKLGGILLLCAGRGQDREGQSLGLGL